jgi:hypothetical protein
MKLEYGEALDLPIVALCDEPNRNRGLEQTKANSLFACAKLPPVSAPLVLSEQATSNHLCLEQGLGQHTSGFFQH